MWNGTSLTYFGFFSFHLCMRCVGLLDWHKKHLFSFSTTRQPESNESNENQERIFNVCRDSHAYSIFPIIGWNLFYIRNNYFVPRPSTAMFSQNCSSTISISSPESLTVGFIDWFVAFCSWLFVRANADSSGSFTLFSTAKKYEMI